MGRHRRAIGLGTLALVAATLPMAGQAAEAGAQTDGVLVVTGLLETVVADDFANHWASTATTLLLPDGTRLDVRRSAGLPDTGRVTATVDVAGLGSERLTTRSSQGLAAARSLEGTTVRLEDVELVSDAAVAGAPHTVHVAVVRNHGSWGGVSEATLRARVDRVLAGWEAEAGEAVPAFDVTEWRDFSPDSGCGLGGSFWSVVGEAEDELYPSVDFTLEPHHLVVLVPDECETGAVGTASIGASLGSGGVSVSSLEQNYGESTLAHEIGHNFGLDHSGGEVCDIDGWCEASSYADLYDVMGGATRGSVPALNSPHRDDLGLLGTAEAATLELPLDESSTSTTVTLRPRSEGAGLRTLRVTEPETLVPWYVDYRSGTGRDATAGYRAFADYPPGVTVMSGERNGSYLWNEPGYQSPRSWAAGTAFTNPAGTVTVRVDAIDPGVSATVTVTVHSNAPPLPVPATVVVTGQPRVDSYLGIDRAGWPQNALLEPLWLVDGAVSDFGDRMWVSPTMRGQMVQLVVSATQPGYRGVVRQSAFMGPVTDPVTGTVQIQAQPLRVGVPVTSSVTTLPVDATRAYQWYVDGDPVTGATGTFYTPTAADAGGRVRLEVTASRDARDPAVLVSNLLGPIPEPLRPGSPTVLGTPAVGSPLTADPGTWPGGTSLTYRWLRDGVPITNATAPSYTPRAADFDRQVAVRVRGASDNEEATATSPSVTIGAGTLTAPTPTVAGRPKVGRKLTAKPGQWTAGTALAFQWQADGAPLRRATTVTLRLTKAHKGKRMSVKVTGTRVGYTTVTRTSARTAAVRR
jgi:hypothetical protein